MLISSGNGIVMPQKLTNSKVVKHLCVILYTIFRSTPKSRPNNMGQMSIYPCTSVRMSVRTQKVFPIPMKFGMQVEVDE